jgi:hypothetical protein
LPFPGGFRRQEKGAADEGLPGGACEAGGDDVGGMPVKAAGRPVIPHRRPRVRVRARLLHITQRDPGVQLVGSNVPTLSNTPAGAGELKLFLMAGDHGHGSAQPCSGLGWSRPGGCASRRPRCMPGASRGLAARKRAPWPTGELGRVTVGLPGAGDASGATGVASCQVRRVRWRNEPRTGVLPPAMSAGRAAPTGDRR